MGLGAKGIPGTCSALTPITMQAIHRCRTWVLGEARRRCLRSHGSTSTPVFLLLQPVGMTISHDYTVSIVQGQMTVTMDGVQIISGNVTAPPVAYLYVTASTGGSYEQDRHQQRFSHCFGAVTITRC